VLDYEIAQLASGQHGLVAFRQLRRLGLSGDAIDRRVRGGRWRRVHRGVYMIGGAPASYAQRVLAACLAVGPDAAASHRAAATLHGILTYKRPPVELTTNRLQSPEVRGARVHRLADLGPTWVTIVDSVPCTTVARTIVDLGAVTRPTTVDAALDRAKGRGLVTSRDVRHAMRAVSRQGRRGVGTIRAILAAERGSEPPSGVAEARMASLLRSAELPAPVPEFVVTDEHGGFVAVVDFAYPDQRLVIEVDGYDAHSPVAAFRHDRSRDRLLADVNWLALHYTWPEVDKRLPHVAAEIARHYRRRSQIPGSWHAEP